jgi:hypothetical protein
MRDDPEARPALTYFPHGGRESVSASIEERSGLEPADHGGRHAAEV